MPLSEPQQRAKLAQQAWEAHAAMVRAESREPQLRANEAWRALRDTAMARCRATLEKL